MDHNNQCELNNKEQETVNESKISHSNRRSLIKGLAGAPLILTIASRPVWANKCSVSGHLSGNLSHPTASQQCTFKVLSPGGFTQSNWAPTLWSNYLNAYFQLTSLAKDLLAISNPVGVENTLTIEQALGGGNHGDLRQATAAALNAIVWERMVDLYNTQNTNYPGYQTISQAGFFFPVTLWEVRNNYNYDRGYYNNSTFTSAQTID